MDKLKLLQAVLQTEECRTELACELEKAKTTDYGYSEEAEDEVAYDVYDIKFAAELAAEYVRKLIARLPE